MVGNNYIHIVYWNSEKIIDFEKRGKHKIRHFTVHVIKDL